MDSPNSTVKMRKLFLQLAVQGKLVEQDPTDEPAGELLKRIKAEKEKLIAEGKIKKQKLLPPITEDEIPYELPQGWECVRLGELTQLRYGKTLPTKDLIEEGYDVFGANGIIGKYNYYIYEEPQLLISCRGAYSGKPNISPPKAFVTNNSIVCEFFSAKSCSIDFFYAVVCVANKEQFVTGSAQPQVTVVNANKLAVPLPPLFEQKRIVSKVDQLMHLCDQLDACQKKASTKYESLNDAALERLLSAKNIEEFAEHWQFLCKNFELIYNDPAHVNKLRQAILQLAVHGKLSPQDPNDEPAIELLKRIKAEKEKLITEGKIKKQKALQPIMKDETHYKLPQGWKWSKLGELAKQIEYGTSQRASRLNLGIPILRMNNINNGKISYDNLKYVDDNIKDLPRLHLKHNDILFNRTNSYELVGKTGIFKEQNSEFTFASYLIRVSLFQDFILPDYVNLVLCSKYFRQYQIEPEITQQCGQANFNGTKLKNSILPLPPLNEQKRIVAKVDQLMHLCDKLETRLNQSKKDSEMLIQAVLYEAFS
jgi:type I restriction enzyme S subunit